MFFILFDVIFLVRLRGEFEIDRSWELKGLNFLTHFPERTNFSRLNLSFSGRKEVPHCSSRLWQLSKSQRDPTE